MEEVKIFYEIYYISLILIYIWENLLAGNFEADRGQDFGKIQLPKTIQKILFPFFHIKRFTYIAVIYQSFNLCILIFMVLIGIFLETQLTVRVFEWFLSYQKFYWLIGPLILSFRTWYGQICLYSKMKKDNKNKINYAIEILKSLNAQSFQRDDNTVFFIEPPGAVKAYVFLIYVERNYAIPEIDYKDILSYLLSKGYLLIYVPSALYENEKTYVLELKDIVHFFSTKYKLQKAPVFMIGQVVSDLPVMILLASMWEDISGMIWISTISKKRLTKLFRRVDLTDIANRVITRKQNDICLININEGDIKEKMDEWLSGKYDFPGNL